MGRKNKYTQYLFHILGSAGFLSLPVIFASQISPSANILDDPLFKMSMINSCILLFFFYVHCYYLIPKLLLKNKYVFYIAGLLAIFSLLIFVHLIVPYEPPKTPPGMPHRFHHGNGNIIVREIRHHWFEFVLIYIFSYMLNIYNRWKQAEKEKAKAELSYLKAQINPHFLFNTLNCIYSLALEKSDNTAPAVVKLSGMMRYVISETQNDFVSIDKEINYINSYIDLQKIRLGDTVKINYTASVNSPGNQIAPLLLIPFIENAFKHGVNAEENSLIGIRIQTDQDELTLDVHNNIVAVKNTEDKKSGLGIDNTKHRLQLLYPSKHKLEISSNEKEFTVRLILQLK